MFKIFGKRKTEVLDSSGRYNKSSGQKTKSKIKAKHFGKHCYHHYRPQLFS